MRTPIIVITAASTMNNAVEAMRRGAHDYLTKPFENLDLVVAAIGRAVEVAAQSADLTQLENEMTRRIGGEVFVRSPAMQEVFKLVGKVVTSDATLLLFGESGTGKEVVAREIHRRSPRARGPFVAVNCSAIPQGLLESELFGHERGSFTGATERRTGKLNKPRGAPSSSTKSATCRSNCSPSSCACCRSVSSRGSAAPKRSAPRPE